MIYMSSTLLLKYIILWNILSILPVYGSYLIKHVSLATLSLFL